MKPAALLALTAGAICAQTVQVYSEFAQLNDAGEVLAPENPREILSPAVARNAFSSFQIAIQVPKGTKFLVYMGQNPEDAAKVMLYRRRAGKLEPVELPYSGESSQVLWMDLWIDAKAPVRRVKIEPQVGIDGDWVTYPMEVRVMEPVVPDSASTAEVASPVRSYARISMRDEGATSDRPCPSRRKFASSERPAGCRAGYGRFYADAR